VDHVLHAWKSLKPGGRLVSIMSQHPFFAEDAKSKDFRTWFDDVGGFDEELPDGTFSYEVTSTSVSARLVVVTR
jgi:hypothetical protein